MSEAFEQKTVQPSTEIYGSFLLNDGEFALPVKCIQEVVNPPEALSPVPLAPPFLVGVFNLRGMVISVIDLKVILGMGKDTNPLAQKKIGIVEYNSVKIGLLFDQTGEIFRNSDAEVSDFHYDKTTDLPNVVSGAMKLEEGKRIVQVLDLPALMSLERVPRATEALQTQLESQKRIKSSGNRRQCISFLVGTSRCGFSIDAIHEIIKVPKLTESAFAHSYSCVGMIELRGDIVPVVDFAKLLKFTDVVNADNIEEKRIIVMKFENEKIGLLVHSVESIVTYFDDQFLAMPLLTDEKPGLSMGCISKEGFGDILLLNPTQVLSEAEIAEITHGHSKIYQSSSKKDKTEEKKLGNRKTYITFRVNNLLALRIDEVSEIISFPKSLIEPPGLPKYIRGMLNLRGKIVTILNTRILYNIEKQNTEDEPKILIFERSGQKFGLMVDGVENIVTFAEEEKIKLPEILYKATDHTTGIEDDVKYAVEVDVDDAKKTILILNLEPLARRVGQIPAAVAA